MARAFRGSFEGPLRRAGLLGAALFAAILLATALSPERAAALSSQGIRLIMVEEAGCRYCLKWEADVGKAYRKSSEGKFAPLVRVKRGAPEIKGFNPVIYTPTFVVVRGGEEIGRITGYPGRDYFWAELQPLLMAIGYVPNF